MNEYDKGLLQDLLDNFDYESVLKIMNLLNWEWRIDEELKRPTIYDIKKCIISLCTNLLKDWHRGDFIESGGFSLKINSENNLELSFNAVEYETSPYKIQEKNETR